MAWWVPAGPVDGQPGLSGARSLAASALLPRLGRIRHLNEPPPPAAAAGVDMTGDPYSAPVCEGLEPGRAELLELTRVRQEVCGEGKGGAALRVSLRPESVVQP